MKPRSIVQIAVSVSMGEDNNGDYVIVRQTETVVALADDGTAWKIDLGERAPMWRGLPPLPEAQ